MGYSTQGHKELDTTERLHFHFHIYICFLGSSAGKESACNAGDPHLIPGLERSPEGGQPTPVFLPGESPWTEEPGGLLSMGLQRVRHD